MNIWGILEIEPTDEISTIKRAYAKKLKVYHPEDNPEGYQRLRECYEAALKLAKNKAVKKELNPIDFFEDETDEERASEYQGDEEQDNQYEAMCFSKVNIFDEHIEEKTHSKKLILEFLNKVNKLYDDFFRRIEVKSWEELLDCEIMWDLNCKKAINNGMLSFLIMHHHIPKKVWQFLNSNFNWDEQDEFLGSCCNENFLQYLYDQLNDEFEILRYCYFKSGYDMDYDRYLDYREDAYRALAANDPEKAARFISLAKEMFDDDPDLLCMEGECFLKIKDKDNSGKSFMKAIEINDKDMDTRFHMASIYFNNLYLHQTNETCKFILKRNPDYYKARLLLARSYMKYKRWYDADKVLLEAIKIRPSDQMATHYLDNVEKQLYRIYKRNHMNFIVRIHLKKIYKALGRYDMIKNIRLTFKEKLKFIFAVFLALIIIYGVILYFPESLSQTGSALIFGMFLLISRYQNKRNTTKIN